MAVITQQRQRQRTPEAMLAIIEARQEEIATLLPRTLPKEQFLQVARWAFLKDPGLAECDERSLIEALLKCARDGLLPDGREAVITPYRDRQSKMKRAVYMPMYQGLMKRMAQLGELTVITAQVVYEKDRFEHDTGALTVSHTKYLMADRGPIIAAFALFRRDGQAIHLEVMPRIDVEKVKRASRATSGPWNDWYEEMARKTAIRRGSKYVPLKDEIRTLLHRDDDLVDLQQGVDYRETGENPLDDPDLDELEAARVSALEEAGAAPTQVPTAPAAILATVVDREAETVVIEDAEEVTVEKSDAQVAAEEEAEAEEETVDGVPEPAKFVLEFQSALSTCRTLEAVEATAEVFGPGLGALSKKMPFLYETARRAYTTAVERVKKSKVKVKKKGKAKDVIDART